MDKKKFPVTGEIEVEMVGNTFSMYTRAELLLDALYRGPAALILEEIWRRLSDESGEKYDDIKKGLSGAMEKAYIDLGNGSLDVIKFPASSSIVEVRRHGHIDNDNAGEFADELMMSIYTGVSSGVVDGVFKLVKDETGFNLRHDWVCTCEKIYDRMYGDCDQVVVEETEHPHDDVGRKPKRKCKRMKGGMCD